MALAIAVFGAPGADAASLSDERPEWIAQARSMAAPWPRLQGRSGGFRNVLAGPRVSAAASTAYGDAVMGLGLIQVGLVTRNRRYVNAGSRAVSYAVRRSRRRSVFQNWAIARSYNLMRQRGSGNRVFRRNRHRWARRIRTMRILVLGRRPRYNNHLLVEAAAVHEVLRTRLRSRQRGTIAGTGRRGARREVRRLVNRQVPRLAPGRRPALLSDPPDDPLAYQGLSLGFYAPLVRAYGGARARRTLGRAVRASCLLQAPSGQLAYAGRSQDLVWVPPSTAYGAITARGLPRAGCGRALARRSIRYLTDRYPVTRRGQVLVPVMARVRVPRQRFDAYVSGPSMNGLALVFFARAIEAARKDRTRIARPRLTSPVIGRGHGQVAVVRRPNWWYAVRLRPARNRQWWGDFRYTAGVVAAERRTPGGWRARTSMPRTKARWHVSAAPRLRWRGRWAVWSGRRMRIRRGVVVVRGVFFVGGYHSFRRTVRRGVLRYRPTRRGLMVSLRVRRGDRVRFVRFETVAPRRRQRRHRGLVSSTSIVRKVVRDFRVRRTRVVTGKVA